MMQIKINMTGIAIIKTIVIIEINMTAIAIITIIKTKIIN
jgi:hypothetical protein